VRREGKGGEIKKLRKTASCAVAWAIRKLITVESFELIFGTAERFHHQALSQAMMEREKRAKQLSIKKSFSPANRSIAGQERSKKEESEVERVKVKRKSAPQIHFQRTQKTYQRFNSTETKEKF
jgi:hypothetical protein